jgi:histone demethylase JARID1
MFSTGMNLDPALFTAGGAMFDKRPSSSGSPRLVHPEASPVFSSPRTSEKHANLDSIFADMVHNDDDHATLGHEGENQLAGEAFAAGGHDQDHPDEAHMDEFVNNE